MAAFMASNTSERDMSAAAAAMARETLIKSFISSLSEAE